MLMQPKAQDMLIPPDRTMLIHGEARDNIGLLKAWGHVHPYTDTQANC